MAEILEHKVDFLIKCECGNEFRIERDIEITDTVDIDCPECDKVHVINITAELEV